MTLFWDSSALGSYFSLKYADCFITNQKENSKNIWLQSCKSGQQPVTLSVFAEVTCSCLPFAPSYLWIQEIIL